MEPDSVKKTLSSSMTGSSSNTGNSVNNPSTSTSFSSNVNGNLETKNMGEIKLPGKSMDSGSHHYGSTSSSSFNSNPSLSTLSFATNKVTDSSSSSSSSFPLNKNNAVNGLGFMDKPSSSSSFAGMGSSGNSGVRGDGMGEKSSLHANNTNFSLPSSGHGASATYSNESNDYKNSNSSNFGFDSYNSSINSGFGTNNQSSKSMTGMGDSKYGSSFGGSLSSQSHISSSSSMASGKPSSMAHNDNSSSSSLKKTEEKPRFDNEYGSIGGSTKTVGHIPSTSSSRQESSFPKSLDNDNFKTMNSVKQDDASNVKSSSSFKESNLPSLNGNGSNINAPFQSSSQAKAITNTSSSSSSSATASNAKRPSIDEGWISVDKNELNKTGSQTGNIGNNNASLSFSSKNQASKPSLSTEMTSKPSTTIIDGTMENGKDQKKPAINNKFLSISSSGQGESDKKAEKEAKPKKEIPSTSSISTDKKSSSSTKEKEKEKEEKTISDGPIRTSGRVRRPVEVVYPIDASFSSHHAPVHGPLVIQKGSGSSFANIPHISNYLAKKKSSDKAIILAHRLLYGRVGEAAKRKANLRLFHGFDTSSPSSSFNEETFGEKIKKLGKEELANLAYFLNLERSGEKVSKFLDHFNPFPF